MDTIICPTIAATVKAGDVLKWGLGLIGGVLVLGAVMLAARWYYRKSMAGDEHAGSFDVENLRKMHEEGQLSDEEFSRLRRTALGLGCENAEKIEDKSSADAKLDDESGNEQDA